MPHKDQLVALLKSFGLTEGEDDHQFSVKVGTDGTSTVTLNRGEGHFMFFAEFKFDADGKFVSHGVWE